MAKIEIPPDVLIRIGDVAKEFGKDVARTRNKVINYYETNTSETDIAKRWANAVFECRKYYINQRMELQKKQTERQKQQEEVIDIDTFSKEFVEKYRIKTPVTTGVPYFYQHGYYTCSNSIRRINARIIKDCHGYQLNQNHISTIYKKVIGLSTGDYDIYANKYVLLNNGLLNLDTMNIEPIDSQKFVTWHMDVNYDLQVSASEFQEYVEQLVEFIDVQKIQEHFGNIFANHYATKKLCYFVGKEHSGKSTLLNILQNLLGEDNYCNLGLADLGDRFRASGIYGKKANICNDVEYKYGIEHVGRIKSLTGGDTMTLEFKYLLPFSYKPIAKHFFSGNGIPTVKDGYGDSAFYARWDFVEFPNKFDPDPSIFPKYTTPRMKSSLLNWMIGGYQRLQVNDWLITNSNTLEDVERMFLNAHYDRDTMVQWLYECCKPTEAEQYTLAEDLFRHCRDWHQARKLSSYPINIDTFNKKMNSPIIRRFIDVAEFHPTVDGRQKPAFRGIKIVRGVGL